LWNYPLWALLLEVGLLFICMFMYLRSTRATSRSGKYAMVIFGLVLVIIQAGIVYAPVPSWLTIEVTAVSLLVYYFATAAVVFYLEKKREFNREISR
jgi:heme A synthase